jgi:hypothetical protein
VKEEAGGLSEDGVGGLPFSDADFKADFKPEDIKLDASCDFGNGKFGIFLFCRIFCECYFVTFALFVFSSYVITQNRAVNLLFNIFVTPPHILGANACSKR